MYYVRRKGSKQAHILDDEKPTGRCGWIVPESSELVKRVDISHEDICPRCSIFGRDSIDMKDSL